MIHVFATPVPQKYTHPYTQKKAVSRMGREWKAQPALIHLNAILNLNECLWLFICIVAYVGL